MTNEPLHILLADDDEEDRLLFKEAFEELKIKTIVHTVNNGMQLIDYLNKKSKQLPNFIFLDLNMPRKNGLTCLKEIRKIKALQEIPVAIYSTSATDKDMEDTFQGGANVYLNKPSDFNVLKQILEKAVARTYGSQGMSFNKDHFLIKM